MKAWSRKQKVYGCVLALGLGALAVDRLVLADNSAPKAADASEYLVNPAAAAKAGEARNTAHGPGPSPRAAQVRLGATGAGVTGNAGGASGNAGGNTGVGDSGGMGPSPAGNLADRLATLAGAQDASGPEVHDAFCPSAAWAPARVAGVPDAPKPTEAERFAKEHKLMAVMAGARGTYAVIDGKGLLPGQELDGFKLVSVGGRTAVLERGAERVTLTMEEGGKSQN